MDRTPWVKSLAGSARDRLYSDAFLASYQSGQTVARRGALSSSWIGVADGLLKIAAVSRSGKIVMFTGIPSGGWIGEGTVLKRELRLYDIVAVRCSTIVHIPMQTFEWLHAHSIEFNHTLIAHLNERLGQYITMMEAGRLLWTGVREPISCERVSSIPRMASEKNEIRSCRTRVP